MNLPTRTRISMMSFCRVCQISPLLESVEESHLNMGLIPLKMSYYKELKVNKNLFSLTRLGDYMEIIRHFYQRRQLFGISCWEGAIFVL